MEPIPQTLVDLFDSVPGNNYEVKLNNLSSCNCCYRHSIYRPATFSPWRELPFSPRVHRDGVDCPCNCRHVARWICRYCPESEEEEVSDDTLR
jgi:hypothetical protein